MTLRNGDEFRILRVGAVHWYCLRAKGEKRQTTKKLDVSVLFKKTGLKRVVEDADPYGEEQIYHLNSAWFSPFIKVNIINKLFIVYCIHLCYNY